MVKLLHYCGLQTHLDPRFKKSEWHADAQAGLEDRYKSDEEQPYVLKSPWLYKDILDVIGDENIEIDEIIIPIRTLKISAASRVIIDKQHQIRSHRHDDANLDLEDAGYIAGGGVFSLDVIDQARLLAVNFYELIEKLVLNNINFRLVSYPMICSNDIYAFKIMSGVLPKSMGFSDFEPIHAKLKLEGAPRVERELAEIINNPHESPRADLSTATSFAAYLREIAEMKKEISYLKDKCNILTNERDNLTAERQDILKMNHESHVKVEDLNNILNIIAEMARTK